MRMRTPIFAVLFFVSCKHEYKKCTCKSKDEVQKAYSEIANELVDRRTYNHYLGEDEERIFNAYVKNRGDSSEVHRIDKEVIRLQNKLFNDTARYCTIFLDTTANRKFSDRINAFRTGISQDIRKLISEVSNKPDSVFNTISTIQSSYLPADFTLCTSKMKFHSPADSICKPCCVGTFRLSNIAFNNSMNKGLLYFEFAGWYGSLISIEKVNRSWQIRNSIQIWIY